VKANTNGQRSSPRPLKASKRPLGWLYLAVVLDIFSRLVVGWAMDAHRDGELMDRAARMALARRHPEPELLHHSDRGSQYTAADYRELLACTASW